MKTARLLTILAITGLLSRAVYAQCDLITVNGSTQIPDGVCAPVTFGMEAHYEFLMPVDPSRVQILYRWNDAANTETLVPGNWNASNDSVWAVATHVYPPDDECSKIAEAILVYDGQLCESSGYQSQMFATWGTDEENSGVLQIEPVVHYVCEGVDVIDFTFDDNSTFNCNINIENDRPNRLDRWVQFTYNTYAQGGDRIPNVTVRDDVGAVHTMTDAGGAFIADLNGPVVRLPFPADGPTETSYAITAPAGGVAGDIFEITLRNWNVCNPYDNTPNDGLPPADPINGDNPPIETTARIEIIAPTPVVVPTLFEYCTGDTPTLTANAGSSEIRWYRDVTLDTLVYVGSNFNPAQAPVNINSSIAGSYSFYVTTYQGICESAPTRVDLNIYQAPTPAEAGINATICADTITLSATPPGIGTGNWSTSGTALISDVSNPQSFVSDLEFGENRFRWTVTNGPCNTSDEVIIFSDRQPDPANAGTDQYLCDIDPVVLSAVPPTHMGRGLWNIVSGNGNLSDSSLPNTAFINAAHDTNILAWRVSSRYDACPVSYDSVIIASDRSPGTANAGINQHICENNSTALFGNDPINEGQAWWEIISGTATISDSLFATTGINNLDYGITSIQRIFNSKLGICPGSSDTVEILRYQSPGIANAGIDKRFCLETQDTLSGNQPLVGTAQWMVIDNPSGVSPVFSPDNTTNNALFSVTPGNEGAYLLAWQLQNGACLSVDSVTIDFGVPVPQAEAGNDTVACGYDFEMHGNSIAIGQGTWSQISGPGPVVYTPNRNTPNTFTTYQPGAEGIYEFEWRFTSGSCPATSDTVQIEITTAPLPPALPAPEACGADSFQINVPFGNARNVAYWYNDSTVPAHFYKGNSYNTGLINSSDTFYIKLRDTVSTCESSRVPLEITIHEIPEDPDLVGDTLCKPGEGLVYGVVTAPANSIEWYNENASSVLDTSLVLSIDTLSHTQTLFARAMNTLTGCSSDLNDVRVIVYDEIPVPHVYEDSACGGSTFVLSADKSVSGNTLFWYNADTNLVSIGDSLVTAVIDSSTVFLVAEYNPLTGCLSDFAALEVTINEIPAIPLINDTSSCGPSAFLLSATIPAAATTFRWYSHPVNNDLITVNDTLTTSLLTANTSYWLSSYNEITGCESPREQVDIAVYPNPGAVDILGPTMVLKDHVDVVFFTINGQPGSVYSWNIPSEIVVEQNMNDFVRLAFPQTGTFTLSVFETTVNGCIGDPVYHSITVIEDSILIDLGDYEQDACTADPYEIRPWLFGGTPPYIYNWTGDTQYLNSTNTLFTTFTPPGAGTFKLYLEVIDVNLKVVRDSVEIIVHESPTTNIINDDNLACVGELFQLQTANNGMAPFTYLWSGPIHRLNSYAIPEPIYTSHAADTAQFYYALTDANGCRAHDSIDIISDEAIANFEVLTDPGCSPLMTQFENKSINAVMHTWDFGGAGSSTELHPSHNFINQSVEIRYIEVNLDVTSPLGCTNRHTDYVMVWPNPAADLTALPQSSCNPMNTLLVSTPGNRYYHWSFGDESNDTTTSAFNIAHIYRNEETSDRNFIAQVITESSLNCTDTATIDLTVFATPQVDFDLTPEEMRFPENEIQLNNNTEGSWNYSWNLGDGNISGDGNLSSHFYEEPGRYTVTLKALGSHCSDSMSRLVHLLPALPVANFKGADNGCMPHTISLINGSEYATSYLWDFGDGNISTAKDPSHTYYEPGIYKIKLKVSGEGGDAIFSDTSRVYVLPHSFFDLAPRYVYVNDEPVHYFNLSDHDDIIEWDFGDGTTSTEHSPKHIYKDEGTYDVTLKVWTQNGCFDLYVMENAVLVEPSGIVEFPNVFRPNSNIEENRVFKPGIIDHVQDYHLMIFNRWGELIYESFDQELGWDGFYQGEIAKQDVYIWKVKGSYSDGKGFVKTGDVTLLY